jgi:hypothetical protein
MLAWITTLIGFTLGAITLWLPGHLIQRAITGRFDFAISLVLSCWLLFTAALACHLIGLPITLWSVGIVLAAICAWPAYAAHKSQARLFAPWPGMPPTPDRAVMTPTQKAWALSGLALCALLFIGALAVSPLNTFDFPIRWDLFPKLLLERQSLAWYPARDADAFKDYLYPDAMPQALGVSVWWLYAWSGSTAPWITALFALAQFLALGSAAGRMAGALGARPVTRAIVELLVLSSPLVLRSLALHQEAGLFSLSYIVCLWALCESRGDTRWLIIASLAAATAICTREYAGFILLPGVLAVVFLYPLPQTPWLTRLRSAALFVAIALAAGLPWYLYLFVLTGNPFFTLDIPVLFPPGIPIWAAIVNDIKLGTKGLFYSERFLGFHMKVLAVNLLPVGLLAIPAGLSARRWPALLAGAGLLVFLWHWASLSSAGGYEFALRVIIPGLILAIILACAWLDEKGAFTSPRARIAWSIALVFFMIHAGLCVIVDRFYFDHPVSQWPTLVKAGLQADRPFEEALSVQAAIEKFPDKFKNAKILTNNPYIAAHNRHLGVTFVPPWSPETAFLYDPSLTPTQKRHKLLDAGITFAIVEPQDIFFLGAYRRAGLYPGEIDLWSPRLSLGNASDLAIIPDDRPKN